MFMCVWYGPLIPGGCRPRDENKTGYANDCDGFVLSSFSESDAIADFQATAFRRASAFFACISTSPSLCVFLIRYFEKNAKSRPGLIKGA